MSVAGKLTPLSVGGGATTQGYVGVGFWSKDDLGFNNKVVGAGTVEVSPVLLVVGFVAFTVHIRAVGVSQVLSCGWEHMDPTTGVAAGDFTVAQGLVIIVGATQEFEISFGAGANGPQFDVGEVFHSIRLGFDNTGSINDSTVTASLRSGG